MKTHKNIPNVLFAISLLAAPASAAKWNYCGGQPQVLPHGQISMRVHSADFPPATDFAFALVDSANAWTHSAADVDISIYWDDTPGPAPVDHLSEVYYVDNMQPPARAEVWVDEGTCQIVEVDIFFRNTVSWTTSTDKDDLTAYGGPNKSFQTTAIHEFGHALGLDDQSAVYSVMGQDSTHMHCNNDMAYAYAGENAIAGAVEVYGAVTLNWEDLALAHWKKIGVDGKYSLHGRTAIVSAGNAPAFHNGEADPVYEVSAGQEIEMELTAENLGLTPQNTTISYYVSTDDAIEVVDQFIGSHNVELHPDTPATLHSPVLTLPDTLEVGHDYWLGAIVDPDDLLSEVDEWNNRTYIRMHIIKWQPDLQVTEVVGSDGIGGSDTLVTPIIENIGGPLEGDYTLDVILSDDPMIDPNDPVITTFTGDTFGYVYLKVPVPGTVEPGTYYWGVSIHNHPEDPNSNNDVAVSQPVTMHWGPPDVAAIDVIGPANAEVGEEVRVEVVIENQGSALTLPYTVTVVLSGDEVAQPGDAVVASTSTDKFGTIELTGVIPGVAADGPYHYGLILSEVSGHSYEEDTSDNAVIGDNVIVSGAGGGPDGG